MRHKPLLVHLAVATDIFLRTSEMLGEVGVSAIFENATDSLRIGMDYFLKEPSYSSRKHAILTLFHAIELLLKERLAETNPILIYKNLDTKITADAQTVGLREAIVRLENLGLGLPSHEKKTVEDIQKVRNRIEHHRYDHGAQEDDAIIASSLKFIIYFVEVVLHRKLDAQVDAETLREITRRIFDYDERRYLAESRFREWLRTKWPELKEEEDAPEEFRGLHACPECAQDWLLIGWHETPFCYYCNSTIDAAQCEDCGRTFLVKEACGCDAYT